MLVANFFQNQYPTAYLSFIKVQGILAELQCLFSIVLFQCTNGNWQDGSLWNYQSPTRGVTPTPLSKPYKNSQGSILKSIHAFTEERDRIVVTVSLTKLFLVLRQDYRRNINNKK